MPDLKKLFESGSTFDPLSDHLRPSMLPELAAISFRSGLNAYFSTYRISGVSPVWTTTAKEKKDLLREEGKPSYVEAYTETILHLHFGIELAIKELLRQKHPLLASKDLPDSAVLLCHILDDKSISAKNEYHLESVEFSRALQRIIELTKVGFLVSEFSIIRDNEDLLKRLNRLRNRIIHRGLFVMDYSAFDLLIPSQVLPFIDKLLSLPQFVNARSMGFFQGYWTYPRLDCGVKPLDEILQINDDTEVTRKKLAFLKDLGRAAYHNPIDRDSVNVAFLPTTGIQKQAILQASHEMQNLNPHSWVGANAILQCPVCGLETLVRYIDSAGQDSEVKCTCCTFNVQKSLGNARDYGIDIDPFWE